jgi:hypothetical protein
MPARLVGVLLEQVDGHDVSEEAGTRAVLDSNGQ